MTSAPALLDTFMKEVVRSNSWTNHSFVPNPFNDLADPSYKTYLNVIYINLDRSSILVQGLQEKSNLTSENLRDFKCIFSTLDSALRARHLFKFCICILINYGQMSRHTASHGKCQIFQHCNSWLNLTLLQLLVTPQVIQ